LVSLWAVSDMIAEQQTQRDRARPRLADVAVGVDELPASLSAVRWAADTAHLHSRSLTIIHVLPRTSTGVPFDVLSPADDLIDATQHLLAEAAAAARARQPGLSVHTRLVQDEPRHGLLTYGNMAAILVLRACAHRQVHDRFLGSTSRHCLTHATTPIALIPPTDEDPQQSRPHRVVVGVDDGPDAATTLRFGLAEAATRGLAVHLVHSWTEPFQPTAPTMALPLPVEAPMWQAVAQRVLDDAITAARRTAPRITITGELAHTKPEPALINASRTAQLMIIGRHQHHRLIDLLLGSVCDDVIHHTGCPVIVVPHTHSQQ
jgi:nucleotide-binding universal stress UspA family protein